MKELSLNILDISENSVKAGASLTIIEIDETADTLSLKITDNGCGMSEEILKNVTDPFYTTRTTRKVGLGVPLLRLEAQMTGGSFNIKSVCESDDSVNHGTQVTATFNKKHIDYTPLGDVIETVITLIQGHPDRDFYYKHTVCGGEVTLDTRKLREQLGEVPLNEYEVIKWVREYLKEQYSDLNNKEN